MENGVFSVSLATASGVVRPFIAGPENATVRIIARSLLEPIRTYMPVVLWGDTGVGKTFLAEGLSELWRSAAPKRKLISTDGVDFARRYADAVDTDSVEDFRRCFRAADLVLCDNVHLLPQKPAAAREFCTLVDHALSHEKLVVCTSSCAPALLGESGFASRLSSGLSIRLVAPEWEARRELLATFSAERGLELGPELLEDLLIRLAQIYRTNLTARTLQSALTQLTSTAALTNSLITFALLEATFPLAAPSEKIHLKPIFSLVARRFKVSLAELRSSSRRQSLVRARGVAALLGREFGRESYQQIGIALGNRDHSTIHHAVEKTQADLQQDEAFAAFVEQIRTELTDTNAPAPVPNGLGKAVASLSSGVAFPALADTTSGRLF